MNCPYYEYKCRRCGAIVDSTRGGNRTTAETIVVMVSMGKTATGFGIPVTPCATHACKDGGLGITDFIGVSFMED